MNAHRLKAFEPARSTTERTIKKRSTAKTAERIGDMNHESTIPVTPLGMYRLSASVSFTHVTHLEPFATIWHGANTMGGEPWRTWARFHRNRAKVTGDRAHSCTHTGMQTVPSGAHGRVPSCRSCHQRTSELSTPASQPKMQRTAI